MFDKNSQINTFDGFMNGEVEILNNNDPRIYGSQANFSRNEIGFKLTQSNQDQLKTDRP